MPAQIDDQSGTECLAGHAAAGAARHESQVLLLRITDQGLNVFLVARHDDASGPHLKNAGVGAVQGAGQVVKEQFALEEALQVFADVLALAALTVRKLAMSLLPPGSVKLPALSLYFTAIV